jgi:A/G-specific adenine glycosylase
MPDREWYTAFRRQLKPWYARHKRDLPWRNSPDPYAVWVSEIMLQQTQVETVKAYFVRFLERFPDVQSLAAADELEVLRFWEGLGYYRRARQLHKAAQVICDEHGGVFPRDAKAVSALPGIGRYTTGAILSIACNQRQPILEANTVRLYSRLLGYAEDPTKAAGQRVLWQFAQDVLPQSECGEFNQALMELGSLVCTPRSPDCDACPVAELCAACREGLQDKIPGTVKRMNFEDRHEVAVVLKHKHHVLLRQCQPGERWAGLWDYPRFTHPASNHENLAWPQIAACVADRTGITPSSGEHLTTIRHGVTRYRIKLDCYVSELPNRPLKQLEDASHVWVAIDELEAYPLSTTGRKISRLVAEA